MTLITSSSLKTARSCLRKYAYAYEQGYRSLLEAGTVRFGKLVHLGLEAWLRTWFLGHVLAAIELANADVWERARARALLIGYSMRWKHDPEEYETIEVEPKFDAILAHPRSSRAKTIRVGGKLDGVLGVLSGPQGKKVQVEKLLIEHKTSSEDIRPGSDYWRRLRMDAQISLYYDGARSLGHEVVGCLYDVIGKPTLRPLKATPVESRKYTKEGKLYANQRDVDETADEYEARLLEAIAEDPDRYYQRAIVVRLDGELDDSRLDAWQTARLLREPYRPRNPDACMQFGHACAYLPVCSGEARLDDQTRFRLLPDVHPELGGDE